MLIVSIRRENKCFFTLVLVERDFEQTSFERCRPGDEEQNRCSRAWPLFCKAPLLSKPTIPQVRIKKILEKPIFHLISQIARHQALQAL